MARGRSKKRGRKKTRRLDPEAVLGGRVEVDLPGLLEIIRRVKPDERGLSPSEEQRRRGTQNRLLSLLISRFADDLAVDWESQARDLAALRLRASGKPVGQALVESLEPQARSWVRERLGGEEQEQQQDAGDPGQGPGGQQAREAEDWSAPDQHAEVDVGAVDEDLRGLSTAKLLRRGRAALAEYDYDEARRHLWQACRRSRGAPEAALELAEVLVNHLAAYQEALQMLPLLSSSAAADPQLRQLLGMAAARMGDHVRAEQLVGALDGEGVVEVYLALATAALGREDDEETGRFLTEARQHGGLVTQELLHLEEQLADLRARRWQPHEARLEEAVSRGDMAAAEGMAQELLGHWPDSAVARRVLAELDKQRRQRRREEVLAEAEAARGREEYATAVTLLRKALELGADREQEQRLARWEGVAQEQEQRAQTQRVLRALGGDDRPAALMAFLDLAPELRLEVRRQEALPALGWLQEMDAPRAGARARAAVDAVLALEQASAAMDAADPARAKASLAPHGKALEGVDRARRVLRRCDELQRQASQARARQALQQAHEALSTSDLPAAKTALEGIERQALDADEVAEVEALLATVHEQEETGRLLDGYQQCVAAEDLMGARQAAALLEQRGGQEADRWRQKQQELTARVRTAWRVQVHHDAEASADLRDHQLRDVHDTAEPWLTASGDELVLVDSHERWIFVRQVELESGRATRLVSLRTPTPMGEVLSAVVDGDALWIAGAEGRLLCLDRGTWDVRRWDDFGALTKQDETIARARVIPPGRYLWVVSVKPPKDWTIRVVDLLRWRVHRRLPGFIFQFPVCGFPEALVACRGDEARSAVFTARGGSATHRAALNQLASDASIHPDGQSVLLLHPHLTEETYEDATLPLALSTLAADGTSSRLVVLEDSDHESIHNVATALDQGLSFVQHWVRGEQCELLALRPQGGEAGQLYNVSVPVGTCLVQDTEAWRVAAMVPSDEDLQLLRLESQEPSLSPRERAPDRFLPRFHPPFECYEEIGANRERADELLARLRELVAGQVLPWARQYFEENQQDVGALVDLRFALNTSGFTEAGHEVSLRTWELFPQDSRVALSQAEVLATDARWDEVRRVLEALPDADMDRPRPRHFYHLLGVAQYLDGEDQRALRTWELGARIRGGRCDIEQYSRFAEPMEDPPRPGDWEPGQPLSRQLRGAVLSADACLARGDAAGAVSALSRLGFFRCGELQSLARLAEAHLRLEPAHPAGLFHKAVALAALCKRVNDQGLDREELPVTGHAWDAGQLQDVAARAAAWLEGYGIEN